MTDRVGVILWGRLPGQNPKPYLCFDCLRSESHECYVLIDLEFNIRITLSARDVDTVIDEGEAWWDDHQRAAKEDDPNARE